MTEQLPVAPQRTRAPGVSTLGDRGSRRWFWAVAYTLLVLLVGTNIPTPLYHGYEARFGFSPLVVTLIFATYVAVLIPSLLLAGPLSDAAGCRFVLLPAVLIAMLGSLVFAVASGTGWLFLARILQGVAVGAASGSLTAALTEFEPSGNPRKAALVSTVASVGGLGLGPVLAGALAQYAPGPDVTPFLVETGLLTPALISVSALPSTNASTPWRPRWPRVPHAIRTVFMTSGAANFLAFAVIGLFLTLIPTLVGALTHRTNLLLGAGAAALMLGSSALVQVLAYGQAPDRLQFCGLPILALGLALLACAGRAGSLTLLLTAAVLAGIGHGLVFLGGLTAINRHAPDDSRAEVLSSCYVVIYSGVGFPVVGVGLLATTMSLIAAVTWFACIVVCLCILLTVLLLGTSRAGLPG